MNKRTMAIARATGVIGTTAALLIGVTFALGLTSNTATLTANSVSSATAALNVWNGAGYATTGPGFTITGLVPGHGSGDLPFYLQNSGTVDLDVTVHVPVEPSASGFTGWQNLTVRFTKDGVAIADTTMQALLAGQVSLPGNPLHAGAQGNSGVPNTEGNYHANFDIVPASVTGSQATVGSFDLVFTGTQP